MELVTLGDACSEVLIDGMYGKLQGLLLLYLFLKTCHKVLGHFSLWLNVQYVQIFYVPLHKMAIQYLKMVHQ